MEIKEYKCPNCDGTISFDSSVQKMKCPYCDSEFEIAALENYHKESSAAAADNFGWENGGAENTWDDAELDELATGACPSCGAELIGDRNTTAMVCPCCGNAQIVEKRLRGMLKPEYVIPFQLDKKAAVEALENFYLGKRLLPDVFKDENKINSIQGLYVPFWLFDTAARGRVLYKATKTNFWADSQYNYTQTNFFSVIREGRMRFSKIPVDGSKKMDDGYMDAIEPFDYTALKHFQSAYLAGYSAEKYDVTAEQSAPRANSRIKSTLETEFQKTVAGYNSIRIEQSAVDVEGGKVSYVLFPVWILNTKYGKENYQFIMNGQTGRLVGKLPADPAKMWKYRLLFAGIFGAALTLCINLLRIFM